MKSKQLTMVIDASACIDCKACLLACKVENNVPGGHFRNWIKSEEPDFDDPRSNAQNNKLFFQPGNCMQCDKPTCVSACPTGATYKDTSTGVVAVDTDLCIGCGNCIPACPYAARYRHPEKKKVDKCDFCATRRARGELPACVITCPTKARTFGDRLDKQSDVAHLLNKNPVVQVVNEKTDTKPNIYYLAATRPLNWTVPAKMPSAMRLWQQTNPLLWSLVGLSSLGVFFMLGKQFFFPDEPAQTEADKTDEPKDQNGPKE
jgi:Fe-S-cluster-containing dehydrogenase component